MSNPAFGSRSVVTCVLWSPLICSSFVSTQGANPKPASLVLLIPTCRNHNKALAYFFLFFPLPADWPWCFPVWPCMVWPAPSSWELWVTNHLFSDSHLLICWPCHIGIIMKPTFYNTFFRHQMSNQRLFPDSGVLGVAWMGLLWFRGL